MRSARKSLPRGRQRRHGDRRPEIDVVKNVLASTTVAAVLPMSRFRAKVKHHFATALALAGLVTGCTTPELRMQHHPAAVTALNDSTKAKVRRAEIAVGYTPQMVELAMGKPLRILPAGHGKGPTWIYRDRVRNENDSVSGGFRRRIVFDPVLRGNVVVVESVDDRLFPNLRVHTISVDFKEGKVSSITTKEEL
jgi:hypothetical protein